MTRLTQAAKSALVALAASTLFASAAHAQYRRTFTVKNDSSVQIKNLYVSSTDNDHWGFDLLGNNVLPPTYYTTVRVVPGYYDVKLVTRAGNVCTLHNMDFTSSDTVDVTDLGLLACELLTN